MPNNLRLMCLSLWLPFLSAQAVASDLAGINVGELGKVQSETILFKAKAERAQAEREATAKAPSTPQSTGPFPTAVLPSAIGVTAPGPRQSALPVVKEISGSGQKLRARLIYSGGGEIDAKPGSELPDDFRVLQITLDGVVLSKEGKRFPLSFGSQPGMLQPQTSLPGLNAGQL